MRVLMGSIRDIGPIAAIRVLRPVMAHVLALGGIVLGSSTAYANPPIVAAGSSKAIVVRPLTLVKVDDLNFGSIIPSAAAGTVVLSPTNQRTATGGVRLASSTTSPASYAGQGVINGGVQLSVGSASGTMTRVGGTETMAFDTFVIGSTPTTNLATTPLSFRIGSATGLFKFPIGATLRVGANQVPGSYLGQYSVIIVYQ